MKVAKVALAAVFAASLVALPACSQQGSASAESGSGSGAVAEASSGASSSQTTVPDSVKVVTAEDVATLPKSAYLVDTRTPEEYEEGHIPGALNASYPHSTGGPCQAEGNASTFRSAWKKLHIPKDAAVCVYCRTGVRASAAASVLVEDGYTDVSLYQGSWTDWTSDPTRPVE